MKKKNMSKLFRQMIRFGLVGAFCTAIDFGIMIFLKELMGVFYLAASGISFTVSVVVNYLLSMRFVFRRKQNSGNAKEFFAFVILSVIGLGLNQLIMWGAVEKLGTSYIISKAGATGLVMVYNFVTKKFLLEEKEERQERGS